MLNYLFEAHLKDGSVIRQTQADVSTANPAKSAWFDVLQRADDVACLMLVRQNGAAHHPAALVVHLLDGIFEVGGARFYALPFSAQDRPLTGGKFRPQYFRRHSLNMLNGTELPTGFAIGWEYVIDGKVIAKQVIEVY